MTIERIIEGRNKADVVAADSQMPVKKAIVLLAENRIGALPVTAEGKVLGVFSERDVIRRLALEQERCLNRPVQEVMSAPAICVTPETAINNALALMTERRVRHLPVLRNDEMIAFISIGDLVKYHTEQMEHEASAMREYIQGS